MFRKGFTLIELLLVIAIIGILAAIVLAGVASTRSKARDAARLTDLRSIASTLEFYYTAKGHYPVAEGWVTGCDAAGANWIPDGTNYDWSGKYIPTMPRDPSEQCGQGQRTYAYKSDGRTYELTTKLENPSPPATTSQTFAYNGSFFEAVEDTTPISITFSTSAGDPTSESPIPLVITFSRSVVDFSQNSLSVLRGVVSGFSAVLADLFNVFVTPTDNNTVVVSIIGGTVHDASGIGNTAAQFTITYDSLLPHPALSPDPLQSPVFAPFEVYVNFTVAVVDFSASSVSVGNGSITAFLQQNGSNYTFTVTPASGGPVTVAIPAGAAHSAAGNSNVASNTLDTTYAGQ